MRNAFLSLCFLPFLLNAQVGYWQQQVHYTMDVKMDVDKNQFSGNQTLVYANNSPDTLRRVFYHLYFNAFQPGSMMDVRSRTIADPDKRVGSRIFNLKPDEIGYQKVITLTQNGKEVNFQTIGTVLEVKLAEPIFPGSKTTFEMNFEAQVPLQIRRTGRNNSEKIQYTMTQWYPKMAAYDQDGWHPDQYVGREFYGPFGTFDVKITLPKTYVLGGTGVVQNPREVGHGYAPENEVTPAKGETLTWHFKAENVHDFAWAADTNYVHDQFKLQNGTIIHLLYNPNTANVQNWKKAPADIEKFFVFMNARFGAYAYPQFSLIQGGDGGMEYPMCTMMMGGGREYKGFFGLFAHEAAHNWFYGMLATNEQRYAWMDEGFTNFADTEAMNFIFDEKKENPHSRYLSSYMQLDSLSVLEPMTMPADRYPYNFQYGIQSYGMGQLMLMQLQYILGEETFWDGMKAYYNRWAFKHPRPEDFIKVMEDASGLELDWFLVYWTQLTHTTDYAIQSATDAPGGQTRITLENRDLRPMPVDVQVTMKNGSSRFYTIPLLEMYGTKNEKPYEPQAAWRWVDKTYELLLPVSKKDIAKIEIDPLGRSCDVNKSNNSWVEK